METGIKSALEYIFDLETKMDVWSKKWCQMRIIMIKQWRILLQWDWKFKSQTEEAIQIHKFKWGHNFNAVSNYFVFLVWRKWIYRSYEIQRVIWYGDREEHMWAATNQWDLSITKLANYKRSWVLTKGTEQTPWAESDRDMYS